MVSVIFLHRPQEDSAFFVTLGLMVEWAEDDLQQEKRISVPEDIYDQGCVKDVDEGLEVNMGLGRGVKVLEPSHNSGSVETVYLLKRPVCPSPPGGRENWFSLDDQSV